MRFGLDFNAFLMPKWWEKWGQLNQENDMESKRSDIRFCCYLQWKSMIFEVWQASESMKNLLKNDGRYAPEVTSHFGWFWIDFWSILGAFWGHEGSQKWSNINENSSLSLWRLLEESAVGFGTPLEPFGRFRSDSPEIEFISASRAGGSGRGKGRGLYVYIYIYA